MSTTTIGICRSEFSEHFNDIYTFIHHEGSIIILLLMLLRGICLQCFDTVGWVSGRASPCKILSDEVLVWLSDRIEVQMICICSS